MKRIRILYLAAAWLFASAVSAEYLVNTRTTYDQTDPAVAMDAHGSHLVVWSSYRQDGDSGGIFARIFDPNCRPVGGEFQVNSQTAGNQTGPDAAMYKAGGFIVVWHGPGIGEQDVYARRFNAEAEPVGGEFRLNSFTVGKQRYPRVAVSPTGAFAAVWESEDPQGEEGDWIAAGRLYDANGVPFGNDFLTSQLPDCRYPDVAMDARGNFVVVWMVNISTNSIMAQLYDSQARATTGAFPVSFVGFGSQTRPAVAMDNDGNFVVTWDGHSELSSLDDIHARAFNSTGTPWGEQFIVNTITERAQQSPRISMTEQGEFVIVWHSESAVEADARDVFARQYNASCMPVGEEFRLNSSATDEQKYPDVAISQNAKYIAAWQSYGQDGSGYGIFATSSARLCPADFSDDGFVNLVDYRLLAEQWLATGDSLAPDLIDDDVINPLDLAEFCRNWLSPCQECRLAE